MLLVKEIVRLFILLDLACLRLLQTIVKPPFVLTGRCQKRGMCCKHIVAVPPDFISKRSYLLRIFVRYHAWLHNFYVIARSADNHIVFACGHLQTDGRCGIYRYRPLICRNYPVLPFFGKPHLLPGCGYSIAPKAVHRMQRRASLPIVNAQTLVHHINRPQRADYEGELPEDYQLHEAPMDI